MNPILHIVATSTLGYFAGPLLVDAIVDLKFERGIVRDLARPVAHDQYDFLASLAVSVGAYLLLGVML